MMGNGFLICLMIGNGRGRWVAKGMVAVVIELRLCLVEAVFLMGCAGGCVLLLW